jgi:hypothetical protein
MILIKATQKRTFLRELPSKISLMIGNVRIAALLKRPSDLWPVRVP